MRVAGKLSAVIRLRTGRSEMPSTRAASGSEYLPRVPDKGIHTAPRLRLRELP
jgi:hypothetical protein